VPVTQTINTKNQMGSASQLWTRNQSFERDFFDMIKGLVSMRGALLWASQRCAP
jgi:NADH:ubiquinone oxidoreductase subunit C